MRGRARRPHHLLPLFQRRPDPEVPFPLRSPRRLARSVPARPHPPYVATQRRVLEPRRHVRSSKPFSRLPFLRILCLGLYDAHPEEAKIRLPILPDWCSDPSCLQSILTDLAGAQIPRNGLPGWMSDSLPRLEALGCWWFDWERKRPMSGSLLKNISWTLGSVDLAFLDRVGMKYTLPLTS